MASVKIILALLLSASCASAQTFSEWFRQQSTQKKYLYQQIAALEMYSIYLKKGYTIAKGGLVSISSYIGNEYNLHNGYYARLKNANAVVRDNPQVRAILRRQDDILLQISLIKKIGLHPAESSYVRKVCDALLKDCDARLRDLATVLSDNQFEMSDEERLKQISCIHLAMQDNYRFAADFRNEAVSFSLQRQQATGDINTLKSLYENH